MSFLFDKKVEHEAACEVAIKACDTPKAIYHAAKAAEFCFALAKQTTSNVANAYIETAEGWIGIAERLKKTPLKATQANSAPIPTSKPGTGDSAHTNESEFLVTDKPDVSFDDIDGMEEAKATIKEMVIYPMQNPEYAKSLKLSPGGGVLLYGPPGNGKTLFGKAIAHEINAPFFYASGAQIRSKWHGESEQRLSALINSARQHPVAVLFLDEVDGLLPKRTEDGSDVDNRLVTQFLTEVGGFKDSDNTLLILGATNNPWNIDEAVFRTGRFDEKIFIGLPDAAARQGMLEREFKDVPLVASFDLLHWVKKLDGYSGSDIVGIAKKSRQIAFRRSIENNESPVVTMDDLEQSFKTIPSSVTPELVKRYLSFNEERFS